MRGVGSGPGVKRQDDRGGLRPEMALDARIGNCDTVSSQE